MIGYTNESLIDSICACLKMWNNHVWMSFKVSYVCIIYVLECKFDKQFTLNIMSKVNEVKVEIGKSLMKKCFTNSSGWIRTWSVAAKISDLVSAWWKTYVKVHVIIAQSPVSQCLGIHVHGSMCVKEIMIVEAGRCEITSLWIAYLFSSVLCGA